MLHRSPVCHAILVTMLAALLAAAAEQPTFVVRRPTIVAFFPPVTQAQLDTDADINETLADFQLYVSKVREPLQKLGIDFHVVFARSFRVRVGGKATVFRSGKVPVGYYFVAPGNKPRVEFGVTTDDGLLEIARDYFRIAAK